jgi:hypothetical protein
MAQVRPGRSPMDSSQPLVPSKPYPPHQPNSFCAPWPVMSPPSTTRKTSAARLTTPITFLFHLRQHGLPPVFPVRPSANRP